ncbi:hypothetical protein [Candidatus Bartonella washoeensis]|uniref:Plasmid replication protein RepL domain-containing protein n=1 Tax=Cardidatus Bartonella washoeensis 085-0475 TaxID=1094564 RepID=J0Z9H9_9HYPH|nr:hypothetical protein [Bartonella washoeensis]EJF84413.1 hypothetical protein MCW_01226 [Bartonella washoeensis 085-0475]
MDNINLRKLEYSPVKNPFLHKHQIRICGKNITTNVKRQKFNNLETHEAVITLSSHVTEEEIEEMVKIDEKYFVETFIANVRKTFNLTRTGYRIFIEVFQIYQSTQLTDSITLAWLNGGLNGVKFDMTDRTFHNGLKELIAKGFLKPKLPNQYWVNPALFFKGYQSVEFVRTYRIKLSATNLNLLNDGYQTNLEDFVK